MNPLTSSRDKKNHLMSFQPISIVYTEGYLAAPNLTQLSNSPAAGVEEAITEHRRDHPKTASQPFFHPASWARAVKAGVRR